jgi:hypothetical protein
MIRRTFFVMTKLVPIISSQYFSMQKPDGHPPIAMVEVTARARPMYLHTSLSAIYSSAKAHLRDQGLLPLTYLSSNIFKQTSGPPLLSSPICICPELALALATDFDSAREQRMQICNT